MFTTYNYKCNPCQSLGSVLSEQFAMSHAMDSKSRSCQSLPAVSAVLRVAGEEAGWLALHPSRWEYEH